MSSDFFPVAGGGGGGDSVLFMKEVHVNRFFLASNNPGSISTIRTHDLRKHRPKFIHECLKYFM